MDAPFSPRPTGYFDNRYLAPGKVRELALFAESNPFELEHLHGLRRVLWTPEASEAAFRYREVRGRIALVDPDATRTLEKLHRHLDKLEAWLAAHDQRVFVVYCHMALRLGKKWFDEWRQRMHFHVILQQHLRSLREAQWLWRRGCEKLMRSERTLPEEKFRRLVAHFQGAHKLTRETMELTSELTTPEFQDIKPGTVVRKLLFDRPLLEAPTSYDMCFRGVWADKFARQLDVPHRRLEKLLGLSLNALLERQDSIDEAFVRYRARELEAKPSLTAALSATNRVRPVEEARPVQVEPEALEELPDSAILGEAEPTPRLLPLEIGPAEPEPLPDSAFEDDEVVAITELEVVSASPATVVDIDALVVEESVALEVLEIVDEPPPMKPAVLDVVETFDNPLLPPKS